MASAIAQTIQSVQYVKKCHVMEESGHIAQVFVEAQLPAGTDEERTRSIKSIVRSIIGAVAMHHNVQLDYRKIKVVEYKPSDDSMLALHPRIKWSRIRPAGSPAGNGGGTAPFRTYSRGNLAKYRQSSSGYLLCLH